MNRKPTFREQYDKIVGAYLRDELDPWSACGCFVGNLLNNAVHWTGCKIGITIAPAAYLPLGVKTMQARGCQIVLEESGGLYTPIEIIELEDNFLYSQGRLVSKRGLHIMLPTKGNNSSNIQEHKLFKAMESTLLMLKRIHESKGEVVEDYSFSKRELVAAV